MDKNKNIIIICRLGNLINCIRWAYPNISRIYRDSFLRQKSLVNFLEQELGDNYYEYILEIGSGIGRFTKFLYKKYRNSNIISIDTNENAIKMLKRVFKPRHNFKLLVHNAIKPLFFNKFDLITGFQIYPFLEQPDLVFESLLKQLKNNGKMVIFELDMFNLETNIINDELELFYNSLKKGFEYFGCHYDLYNLKKHFNKNIVKLEIKKFVFEEKTVLRPELFNMLKNANNPNSELYKETVDFYYQFLSKAGWSRIDSKEFFKKFLTFEIYREHIGELLIKKIPYYSFKIKKMST